jgi:hypothetical protein
MLSGGGAIEDGVEDSSMNRVNVRHEVALAMLMEAAKNAVEEGARVKEGPEMSAVLLNGKAPVFGRGNTMRIDTK